MAFHFCVWAQTAVLPQRLCSSKRAHIHDDHRNHETPTWSETQGGMPCHSGLFESNTQKPHIRVWTCTYAHIGALGMRQRTSGSSCLTAQVV